MKKGNIKNVLLLTLAVLQVATAADISALSVRAYEEEILIEEASDADSSFEILSEDPKDELIEEKIDEQEISEELLTEETSEEETSSEDASVAASSESSEEAAEETDGEDQEAALNPDEAGEEVERLFGKMDSTTAELLEAEKQLAELTALVPDITTGSCGKDLTYTLNVPQKTLRISGKGAMTSYSRSNMAPWYRKLGLDSSEEMKFLETIIIEEGVTSVGNYAFINMPNVRKIVFPKSLKSIGKGAFSRDRRLIAIGFMGNLPEIGTNAFEDSDLVAFYYKGSKGFTDKNKKKIKKNFRSLTFKKLEDVQDGKCGDGLDWSYDTASNTLRISGQGAMKNFSFIQKTPWYMYSDEIKNVVIENGVTSIGDYAFYDMKLDSCNFPATLNYIGNSAFELTTVTTFSGADALKNVTYVGKKAFAGAKVDLVSSDGKIHLDKAQTLGEAAFSACKMGTSGTLILSDDLRTIPVLAFQKCKAITGTLKLPASLEYIELGAFYDCEGLSGSLTISDNVKDIGEYAFGYTGFTDVTTGDGIKQIRYSCFGNKLVTMRVGRNVNFIEACGIDSNALKELYFFGNKPAIEYKGVFIDYTEGLVIYYPDNDPTWEGIDSGYFTVNGYTFTLKKNTTQYTVKFNITYPTGTESKDKKTLEPVSVSKGDRLPLPMLDKDYVYIKNDSYYFSGWYSDSKFKNLYDFKSPVNDNMTLYGKYVKDPDRKLYWGGIFESVRRYMKFNTPDDVPEGIWYYTKGLDTPATYTGNQIRPGSFSIYFGKTLLFENTDYTRTFKNNVNVGTATMTIKFMNNLSGEVSFNYKIAPIELNFTGRDKYYAYTNASTFGYNKKVQKPKAYLKMTNCMGTFSLEEGKDYEVIYPGTDSKNKKTYDKNAFKAPGKYRITVKGKGNYTGELYCNIEIKKKTPIKSAKSNLPKSMPAKKLSTAASDYGLKYNGKQLIKDVDYKATTGYNLEKGFGFVEYEATRTGDFSGTFTKKFKLTGPSLSKAAAFADGNNVFVFKNSSDRDKFKKAYNKYKQTGQIDTSKIPQTINKFVDINGPYLKNGKKYIEITGDFFASTVYMGKKVIALSGPTINDVKLVFKNKVKYDGFKYNIDGAVAVMLDGEDITDSGRCKVELYDGLGASNVIRVTGKQDLLGTKDFEIPLKNIEKYDLSSDCNIYISSVGNVDTNKKINISLYSSRYDKTKGGFPYQAGGTKPTINITKRRTPDAYPYQLKDTDYTVTYQNCNKIGTGKVIIQGTGLFTGTIEYEYKIIPNSYHDIFAEGTDIIYQEKADIYKTSFTIRENETLLKAGVDYDPNNIAYMYGEDTKVKRLNSKGKYTTVQVHEDDKINPKDIIPAYTALYVKVPLTGNYTGNAYAWYYVLKERKDISKATVEYKNYYEYTGVSKFLKEEDFVVKLNGTTLTSDDFYIKNNHYSIYNVGTYTYTLEGNGKKGYTGSKTVTVTVGPKKVKGK